MRNIINNIVPQRPETSLQISKCRWTTSNRDTGETQNLAMPAILLKNIIIAQVRLAVVYIAIFTSYFILKNNIILFHVSPYIAISAGNSRRVNIPRCARYE